MLQAISVHFWIKTQSNPQSRHGDFLRLIKLIKTAELRSLLWGGFHSLWRSKVCRLDTGC